MSGVVEMQGPGLIAFPKGYFDDLCSGNRPLESWIEEASKLGVDGIEMYPYFYQKKSEGDVLRIHDYAKSRGLLVPMMCTSPDFTNPDREYRKSQIDDMLFWIKTMSKSETGGRIRTCRVLSGQRRPQISREDGIGWVVESIEKLIPYAEEYGVHLVMENHYKDGRWIYPEFAQSIDIFEEIVNSIHSPWFGINYDPSNALVSGQDPIEVLRKFKRRILTMHASDRHLKSGYSLEDLKKYTGVGYPESLEHGVVGTGLIDYDSVFGILKEIDFNGWISIEDGVNGNMDLVRSVSFLAGKIRRTFR